jgi:Putative amidase domain
MSNPDLNRAFRRRRALVLAAATIMLVAGGATIAWTAWQQGGESSAAAPGADTAAAPTAEAGADDSEASGGDLDTAGLSASVASQLEYVHAHWDDTESDRFGFIDENDCVNFASQSLLARGWEVDDEWWYDEDGDAYVSSDAWISSTMLRWYLEDHPERATALTDDQRDQVKVGDLVQFDWDDSGDRDHTGIVTAVIAEADGSITIEYAGHTDATWDRSVDWAITELHPGGVAYYWSIPE